MRTAPEEAPVVVGVGAGGGADDAVEWASAEAAASGSPLRIVHVVRSTLPADPFGVTAPVDGLAVAREVGEDLLREAVTRARAVASEVDVSALLVPGTPARTLPDHCAGARLLVLGGRPRVLRTPWGGCVPARAAARCCCPVVVVRSPRGARGPSGTPPRVVVGVDAAASCPATVDFALQAARRRGVPLVAVHAWRPDLPADLEAAAEPPQAAEERARRALDRAVRRRHPAFAHVPVHAALVRGDPAAALLAHARGAALLVVGARGRGRLLGPVLGPVVRAVVRRGDGPLAVVREDGDETPAAPDGWDRAPGGDLPWDSWWPGPAWS